MFLFQQDPNAGNSRIASWVMKSVGAEGDFKHFPSSEQQAGGTKLLIRYDFLLVLCSDLGLAGTTVEL